MSNPWTDQLEKLLLFTIIPFPDNVPKTKFEEAADKLGNGLNWNGCRQKFYKLKRDAEKLLSGDGGGATAAALKTPANKGEKTTPQKSTGGSKRKKADSGDEVEETPTKKKKATVKVEVKNEPDANDTKQPKVEDVEENESGL